MPDLSNLIIRHRKPLLKQGTLPHNALQSYTPQLLLYIQFVKSQKAWIQFQNTYKTIMHSHRNIYVQNCLTPELFFKRPSLSCIISQSMQNSYKVGKMIKSLRTEQNWPMSASLYEKSIVLYKPAPSLGIYGIFSSTSETEISVSWDLGSGIHIAWGSRQAISWS